MAQQFPRLNGVTLKPGVRVLCTDRDHGNWDYEGTIVAVESSGTGGVFDVEFGNGYRFQLDYDQIEPTLPNTPEATAEAELWKAARQLKVFLCHGSEDKAVVRDLYDELRRADMRPWLDERDIQPGQEWDGAIRDAVAECHIVLVILSHTSIAKTGYVQKEIRFALDCADERPEGTTYIIPVKLDDAPVPKRLAKWQWISLVDGHGRERLMSHLRTLALERLSKAR